MRTHSIPPCYRKIKEILIMPPDLALLSTLICSNYPCLEPIFMVPKVFEPLKFDCIHIFICPFETYAAFEGGNKYLCFKHKINS